MYAVAGEFATLLEAAGAKECSWDAERSSRRDVAASRLTRKEGKHQMRLRPNANIHRLIMVAREWRPVALAMSSISSMANGLTGYGS